MGEHVHSIVEAATVPEQQRMEAAATASGDLALEAAGVFSPTMGDTIPGEEVTLGGGVAIADGGKNQRPL
jgi:hypothetical protein